MKHVGDQCFKCNLGQFDVYSFIPDVSIEARGTQCRDCPSEEHLHIACVKCGYMEWSPTAEQVQLEEVEREKLS